MFIFLGGIIDQSDSIIPALYLMLSSNKKKTPTRQSRGNFFSRFSRRRSRDYSLITSH